MFFALFPGETAEEYQLIREHVRIGERVLEPMEAYAGIIPVVLHHHEYYDGSGYPGGFSREDIALGARLFTVPKVIYCPIRIPLTFLSGHIKGKDEEKSLQSDVFGIPFQSLSDNPASGCACHPESRLGGTKDVEILRLKPEDEVVGQPLTNTAGNHHFEVEMDSLQRYIKLLEA